MSASAQAASGAGRPARVEFQHAGEGVFRVAGELSFASAGRALADSIERFREHAVIQVDLAGVTRADSAGLALLLEWVNWARNNARELQFRNIPRQLLAIAEISEVEGMLQSAESWNAG